MAKPVNLAILSDSPDCNSGLARITQKELLLKLCIVCNNKAAYFVLKAGVVVKSGLYCSMKCRRKHIKVKYVRPKGSVGYYEMHLPSGHVGKISVKDHKWVRIRNWYVNNDGYLATKRQPNDPPGASATVKLHKLIHPNAPVDHINRDRLDNRRGNLREVPQLINARNSGLRSDNKTGVRGVFQDRHRGGWRAELFYDGRNHYIGRFSNFDEAVAARKAKEDSVWGDNR